MAKKVSRKVLALDDYVDGVLAGDRTLLARAITLVESSNPAHQELAQEVMAAILPRTGDSMRIGISGVPGVGKSTFIETLGLQLIAAGHRVAVLAVDPSSERSGGSILGDKTRMNRLATAPEAFIRPSPASGTLGGVASKTRESLFLCEAAGFDVVLVETVGVGQSETEVARMTDFFLALMLAGAGDELQGIKRGLLELVDMIAINKADGDNLAPARRAARDHENALDLMRPADADWKVPVLCCSALENEGLDEIWNRIAARLADLRDSGRLDVMRRKQMLQWMWAMVDRHLHDWLRGRPEVKAIAADMEKQVLAGKIPAVSAAREILRVGLHV